MAPRLKLNTEDPCSVSSHYVLSEQGNGLYLLGCELDVRLPSGFSVPRDINWTEVDTLARCSPARQEPLRDCVPGPYPSSPGRGLGSLDCRLRAPHEDVTGEAYGTRSTIKVLKRLVSA